MMKASGWMRLGLTVVVLTIVAAPASAYFEYVHWDPEHPWVGWGPGEYPEPTDSVVVYYDTRVTGAALSSSPWIWWGINDWTEPAQQYWPAGSVVGDAGSSVHTPMVASDTAGVWLITIPSDASFQQLDFVFNNSSKTTWDSPVDWHLYLTGEAPPTTWHRFVYDARSAGSSFQPEEVTSVHLRGPFNGFGDADPMVEGPAGVWTLGKELLASPTRYKFFVNGTDWEYDPDNLEFDGSDNALALVAKNNPYPMFVTPEPGTIQDDPIAVRVLFHRSDTSGVGFASGEILLDGSAISSSFVGTTDTLAADIPSLAAGPHTLQATVTDSNGAVGSVTWRIMVNPASAWFVDNLGDEIWDTPSGVPAGAGDLDWFRVQEAGGGDSLRIEVALDTIAAETRVMLKLLRDFRSPIVEASGVPLELTLPQRDGMAFTVHLADPASPEYDPALHNVLILEGSGTVATLETAVTRGATNQFTVAIGLADLTAAFGSYNQPWYYSVASYLDGPAGTVDHAWEADAASGASDAPEDPDVLDAMFYHPAERETHLLTLYRDWRPATLDGEGRGFRAIAPDEIGPNVNPGGPTVEVLTLPASTVRLGKRLHGRVAFATSGSVEIFHSWDGGNMTYAQTPDQEGLFTDSLPLYPGENTFVARATENSVTTSSPVLTITRKVPQAPYATNFSGTWTGSSFVLSVAATDDQADAISYSWTPDPDNPEMLSVTSGQGTASITVSGPEAPGDYYVDLELSDGTHTGHARALLVKEANGTGYVYSPSSIGMEPARWIRGATIYQIFPWNHASSNHLQVIAADMPRIAALGVDAIWLTPIYPGPTLHGYEITDYRGIDETIGTFADFETLVQAAHAEGVKVILDMVNNHTSNQHPWHREQSRFGKYSHYYTFYEENVGMTPYYSNWFSLPNLNYSNEDVRDYFIETSLWWIENYDVDGFRCDVAWGPMGDSNMGDNPRSPGGEQFWSDWRHAIKLVKPEAFLLGEASATDSRYMTDKFDSAYDWSFYGGTIKSVFDPGDAVDKLHNAVTNTYNGIEYGFPDGGYPFRFMENHDEQRYISEHTVAQTKAAAAIIWSIPGTLNLYGGQEVGDDVKRYWIEGPQDQIDFTSDPNGFITWYSRLIDARRRLPSLAWGDYNLLATSETNPVSGDPVADKRTYCFTRHADGYDPVFAVHHVSTIRHNVTFDLPVNDWGLQEGVTYVVTDILTGESFSATKAELATMSYERMDPYEAHIYVVSDQAFTVSTPEEAALPLRYELAQNYPNPFNPSTVIGFELPEAKRVTLTVYNMLGQRVARILNQPMRAGRHTVAWHGTGEDGHPLASGLYLYRLEAGDFVKTRKMLLIK